MDALLERFREGDVLAASRLMSVVERGGRDARRVLDAVFPRTGSAWRVAITGATGGGKSTLVDALVARWRGSGRTVGVVAEDPSSPLTGGAVLGDRVRMQRASGDPGVFVRSIASRGAETGFSPLGIDLCDVLDAFGRDVIVLETAGVGQLEHRVRFAADSVVVVLTPESGDAIQGLKAGLMEIGDVYVVNKADRPGAAALAADLEETLALRGGDWTTPVVTTTATTGEGVVALDAALERHAAYLRTGGRLEARRRLGLRERIRALALARIHAALDADASLRTRLDAAAEDAFVRRRSPWRCADALAGALAGMGGEAPPDPASRREETR